MVRDQTLTLPRTLGEHIYAGTGADMDNTPREQSTMAQVRQGGTKTNAGMAELWHWHRHWLGTNTGTKRRWDSEPAELVGTSTRVVILILATLT
jgi:hypothetical protein